MYIIIIGGGLSVDSFRNQECQVILSSFALLFAFLLFLIGRKIRMIGKSKEVRAKNVVDNIFTAKPNWRMYAIGFCIMTIGLCFMVIFILHRTKNGEHNFIVKKFIIILVEVARDTIILIFLHKKKFKHGNVASKNINSESGDIRKDKVGYFLL